MTDQRFVSVSSIRAEVRQYVDDVLADAIGQAIARVVEERCAELEARIKLLEVELKIARLEPAASPVPHE